MNNVSVIGRFVRDPEFRYTKKGKPYLFMSIAVNKSISKEKKTELEEKNLATADFFNVISWGKQAENGAEYLKKGLKVGVTGNLESGSYSKDGKNIYYTRIRAGQIDFLEWPKEEEFSPPTGFEHTPLADEEVPF